MAMNISQMRDRWKEVREGLQGSYLRDALSVRESEIMSFQYQQLFEGKASDGEDIRPYYSEDIRPSGYFKSKASAANYAAWKQSGIPYPFKADRNPDAPNLYITGKFHEELGCKFGQDDITIAGNTAYAAQIVAKYGLSTFGLTRENWGSIMRERGVLQEVYDKIINEING